MKRFIDGQEENPEALLRGRIRGQLTAEPTAPQETGTPIPAAPFAPEFVPPRAPEVPATPEPSPAAPPATPSPATPPPPVVWQPAPSAPPPATPPTRVGIPGGPETRPGSPTVEAPGPGPSASGDDRAWFYSLFGGSQGSPLTPAQLAALGPKLAERGYTLSGIDSIRSPSGMIIDVIQGAKSGQNLAQWLQPNQGGSGGAAAGGGAGGGGLANPGSLGGGGAISEWMSQIRAMVLAQIKASQQPVDPNEAAIADPLSAARDEVSRGQDAERKALAERLYASGDLHSSTLPQQLQQSSERNATGLSQLRAGLVSKAYTQKQEQLAGYLQLAIASGDAELARQIQLQIANLQAAINRESLGLQKGQIEATLSQQAVLAGLGK